MEHQILRAPSSVCFRSEIQRAESPALLPESVQPSGADQRPFGVHLHSWLVLDFCSIYHWSDEYIVLEGMPAVFNVDGGEDDDFGKYRAVTVTRSDGASATVDSILYFAQPEITRVNSPDDGFVVTPSGGILVTLTGRNLGYPEVPLGLGDNDWCQPQICFSEDPSTCCTDVKLVGQMCTGEDDDETTITWFVVCFGRSLTDLLFAARYPTLPRFHSTLQTRRASISSSSATANSITASP